MTLDNKTIRPKLDEYQRILEATNRRTKMTTIAAGRAMAHVDALEVPRVELWTFAGLDAARHLYESQGFALVEEQEGARWGRVVREQRFVRQMAKG